MDLDTIARASGVLGFMLIIAAGIIAYTDKRRREQPPYMNGTFKKDIQDSQESHEHKD